MGIYQELAQRSSIQQILQTVKDFGPISKRELQERTGLSWSYISQVTKRFLEQEYIVVCGKEMTAGRAREVLDINQADHYFIGADLNYQRVRIVLTDMKGCIVHEMRRSWTELEYQCVIDTVFSALDDVLKAYSHKHIYGIGFAVQGVVDVANGISVRIDKIQNWKNVRLKRLVEQRYHIPTVIAHDPDCMMKCECHLGVLSKTQTDDVVLIHYHHKVGIGMSIMINGQIYIGSNGMAGEIGYTILDKVNGTPKMLGHFADKADTEEDVSTIIDCFGRSVATVNSLFNPSVVVLCITEDIYRERIIQSVSHYLHHYSCNDKVRLEVSKLNKNAKALGAALIAIDKKISTIT